MTVDIEFYVQTALKTTRVLSDDEFAEALRSLPPFTLHDFLSAVVAVQMRSIHDALRVQGSS